MVHITMTITKQQVANFRMNEKTENKLIIVKHTLNYGKHYFYPVNELAKKALALIGEKKKAFTKAQIETLKQMQYTIEIQPMVNIDGKNN